MQQVLNGSVHEETPLINQQSSQQPQQQQQQPPPPQPAQQHQYITEPASQTQFVPETELDTATEQQQPPENEPQTQTNETREQPETETFAAAQESEPEHPVSDTNVTSSGPKTYATLVKSFPSSTGATSPQAPKLSMSPVYYNYNVLQLQHLSSMIKFLFIRYL